MKRPQRNCRRSRSVHLHEGAVALAFLAVLISCPAFATRAEWSRGGTDLAIESAQRCTLDVTFTAAEAVNLREWYLVWSADPDDEQPLRVVASEGGGSSGIVEACAIQRDKDGDRGVRVDTVYFCASTGERTAAGAVRFVLDAPSVAPTRIAVIPILEVDGRTRADGSRIAEASINGGSALGYPPVVVDIEFANKGDATTYRLFGAFLDKIRDAHIRHPDSRTIIPMRILSRSDDSIELEGPLLERVGCGLVEVRNRSKQWTGIPVDWSASGLKRSLAPRLVIQVDRGALSARTGAASGESAGSANLLPWLADALTRAGVVSLTSLPSEQFDGAARAEATNLLGEPIELTPLDDWFVATLALDAEVADVVDRVRNTLGVRDAAEDRWSYLAHLTPNDPRFAQQWGLRNLGGTVCGYTAFGTVDVGAASAWDQTTGSPSVRMAVLDSGINPDHEDFGPGRVGLGPDYSTGGGGGIGTAYDTNGHGTAVAGIAAALGNNGAGVAGVDWQVQPWAVRVLDQYGGGYPSQLGQGIQWATDQWMPIMNMSLGWTEAILTAAQHNLLADKTLNAFKRGLFLVASSGNTEELAGPFVACPAHLHQRVYAVGAFLPNGQRWQDIAELGVTDCPYFDPCMASNSGPFLDAMAPGGRLIATTGLGSTEYHDLSGCVTGDRSTMAYGGTSAAAPVVSGTAALLLSRRPDLIGEDIAQILNRTTAGPYAPGTWIDDYGWGRVKASSALNFVGPSKVVAHWSAGPSSNTLGPLLVIDSTSIPSRQFRDVPGMPTADYTTSCVRYRLRATLTWPFAFAPGVVGWTRSSGTLAWKDVGFYDYRAEVDTATFVPSTFGTTGVTVEAFVFRVLDASNPSQTIGWFPTDPDHARVALTVIGNSAGTTDAGPATVAANLAVSTLPNPSRGAVRMVVDVPTRGRVRATVLDLAGRRVATLVERELEAGRHEFRWEGTTDEGGRCGAGVYFCRVDCGGIATIKRFIRLGGN